jgi:hypothetical protein
VWELKVRRYPYQGCRNVAHGARTREQDSLRPVSSCPPDWYAADPSYQQSYSYPLHPWRTRQQLSSTHFGSCASGGDPAVRVAGLEEFSSAVDPVLSSARGRHRGHEFHTKGFSWLRRLTSVEKHLRIIALTCEASERASDKIRTFVNVS